MPGIVDKIAIGTTVVNGMVATTGGIMTSLGFTSSGIAAGSIAAGIQSQLGSVAAGSAFSVAQSLGAKGVLVTMTSASVVIIIVGGGGYLGYKIYKKRKEEEAKAKL